MRDAKTLLLRLGPEPETLYLSEFVYLWLTLHKGTLESLTMYLGAGMLDRLGKNIELDEDLGEGDVSLGPRHEVEGRLMSIELMLITTILGLDQGYLCIYNLFSS